MTVTARDPAAPGLGAAFHTAETDWPLAGSDAFARTPAAWRDELAARLRRDLQRHVIETWFPRSVDAAGGGFVCDFDRRWRARGPQQRMLEFQARQTRSAARLGIALPGQVDWPAIARHGLRYLRDVMRDPLEGGWFCMLDASGNPLAGGTKHAHGTAYVITAAVEVFRLTGDEEALALAREAYDWVEQTLHDDDHGGYHGWATRDGQPILEAARAPAATGDVDPLGHGIGLKDANVHSDLLEGFRLLYAEWPDAGLQNRLAELFDIFRSRFITPAGSMHYLLYQDLTVVPGIERFGYPLQTAARLPLAAPLVGRSVDETLVQTRRMVDHVLSRGWDARRGGFIEGRPAAEPDVVRGVALSVPLRTWWIQTEGVVVLALLALTEPSAKTYRLHLEQLLDVIDAEFIDRREGGWYQVARGDWSRRTRVSRRGLPKGDVWKDASHETDMYVTMIRMLRGLPAHAPIDGAAPSL